MLTMKKITLALLLSAISLPALAEHDYFGDVQLKFGGWSKHITAHYDNYDYNESHFGIGAEWTFYQSKSNAHNFSVGYFKMEDSFNKESHQTGLIYTYKPKTENWYLDAINYNVTLVHMKRGIIHRSLPNFDDATIKVESFFTALPYITVNFTDYVNVDLMYVRKFNDATPDHTLFIRGGINLSKISKL
ncbi:hypothetical protein ACP3V3_02890 [Vibrio sp. PNB22_3_1]